MPSQKSFSLGLKMTASIGVITAVTLLLICTSVITLKGQKDDSTIINIAGRQRMLSQKMSKEAMAIHSGLAVEKNRAELKKTHNLFETSLQNLIQGNAKLNLPPTNDQSILTQMNHVQGMWHDFSDQTASALDEIYQGVIQVSELVEEIATASHEQSLGITQANSGLNQLDSVNQNSTAIAEETASVTEELSSETLQLQEMLNRFKISQGSLMQLS